MGFGAVCAKAADMGTSKTAGRNRTVFMASLSLFGASLGRASPAASDKLFPRRQTSGRMTGLTHLDRLEAESLFIFREAVAEADRPVLLTSMGKDSAVMLHLAKKA